MNNELKHYRNPIPLTIFWLATYLAIVTIVGTAFWFAADQVQSHTLPTGNVTLTTDYSKYVVGETVGFTIKNNYNSSIHMENSCPDEPLTVYKLVDNKWVRQHAQASPKDCPAESREVSVAAGQSVSGSFKAWPKLFSTPGKYRVVAFVEYYNSLPYKDIEIIDKPAPVNNSPAAVTDTNPSTTDATKNSDETNTTDSNNHEIEEELEDD